MKKWKYLLLFDLLLFLVLISINKYYIVALVCIFIHEITHIIVARGKGSKFDNLQIHFTGANVELNDLEEITNRDKFFIYISGPLANIFLAGIFAIINTYVESQIIKNIVELNLGLAIFNLMPAYPLDGARIMEIFLCKKLSFKKAQKIISICSYTIALFFMFVSISAIFYKQNLNITIMISAFIIAYITNNERKRMMYILMGSIFKKRKNFIKNKYIENKIISVYSKQGLVSLFSMVEKNKFNTFYVLDDDLKMKYIIHEDELIEALKEYGNISLEEYEKIR